MVLGEKTLRNESPVQGKLLGSGVICTSCYIELKAEFSDFCVVTLLFLCVLLNLCCGSRECECACVGGCKRKVMGLELICPGLVLLLFRIRPPTSCVPAWNVCLFSTDEASDSALYCTFTRITARSSKRMSN